MKKLGSLATHLVYVEGFDQIGRIPKLIWVFAGRTCHFVGFVVEQLIYVLEQLNLEPTEAALKEKKQSGKLVLCFHLH